jgi:hypothetical protein
MKKLLALAALSLASTWALAQGAELKVAIDPHFSFANMLCDVAWARAHGTSVMFLPQSAAEAARARQGEAAMASEPSMPGLPQHVADAMNAPPPAVCGTCEAFEADRGWCSVRGLRTTARDPECPLYVLLPNLAGEGAG